MRKSNAATETEAAPEPGGSGAFLVGAGPPGRLLSLLPPRISLILMAKKTKPPVAEVPAVSEQPYYLQRAHIKDFRSIRDAKVEFKPGLNIIIGANGSGKTNFLKCVKSGLSLTSDNFIGGSGSVITVNGNSLVEIHYERNYDPFDETVTDDMFDAMPPQDVVVKYAGNLLSGESLLDVLSQSIKKENSDALNDLLLSRVVFIHHGVPNPYTFAEESVEFVVSGVGRVNARNKGTLPLGLNEMKRTASYIFSQYFVSNKQRMRIDEMASVLKEGVDIWLAYLKYYLSKFSAINDIKSANPVQAYDNRSENEIIVKGFAADYKIGNSWLPFSALSDGTRRMFYILSEASAPSMSYFRKELINEVYRLDYNKIILLEEPELGIHPDQLHKLLLFLREQSEKHQLIITTHSPQVLDMLNDDELDRITICELDEKKGTQFRKLKKAQIETAKKFMHTEPGMFLSDYWRYGNLEGTN